MYPRSDSSQRVPRKSIGNLNVPSRQLSRQKVALKPGHSPLDWAALTSRSSPYDLRGVPEGTPPPQFLKVSSAELKLHGKINDCWTCINGKVFNITPYVDFHPGGVDEIMKCAGKDGTFLFNKYHSWVNPERLLEKCLVGILVETR